jgi:hypothetical protein
MKWLSIDANRKMTADEMWTFAERMKAGKDYKGTSTIDELERFNKAVMKQRQAFLAGKPDLQHSLANSLKRGIWFASNSGQLAGVIMFVAMSDQVGSHVKVLEVASNTKKRNMFIEAIRALEEGKLAKADEAFRGPRYSFTQDLIEAGVSTRVIADLEKQWEDVLKGSKSLAKQALDYCKTLTD